MKLCKKCSLNVYNLNDENEGALLECTIDLGVLYSDELKCMFSENSLKFNGKSRREIICPLNITLMAYKSLTINYSFPIVKEIMYSDEELRYY